MIDYSDEIDYVVKSKTNPSNYRDKVAAFRMPTNLVDFWTNRLSEVNDTLLDGLSQTKSPIEQMFLLQWNTFNMVDEGFMDIPQLGFYMLAPQYQVPHGKSAYKVDFCLWGQARPGFGDDQTLTKVFIELDGHEFHEKTKQQVAHDKERERFLSTRCDALLRFSGHEVFVDTAKCCLEVAKVFLEKCSPKLNSVEG